MDLPGYNLVSEVVPDMGGAIRDWYLAGRPVLASSELDILMATGNWVAVIVGSINRDRLELWMLFLGGPADFTLQLPTIARFRWTQPRPMLRVLAAEPARESARPA